MTSAALVDIGEVGYRTGWRIVDLTGLVDPVIGRSPGRHGDKHFPIAHFAAARPDVVVIRSESPPKLVPGPTDGWWRSPHLVGGDLAQFIRVVSNELPVRLLGARHGALHPGAHGARRPRPRRRPLGGPGCHPLIIPPDADPLVGSTLRCNAPLEVLVRLLLLHAERVGPACFSHGARSQ